MTGLLNTIILLGTLQGSILSIVLFCRSSNKRSNRLLGCLILLMAMASLHIYCNNAQVLATNKILHFVFLVVPFIVVMPMGPLIYFYIQSMLNPSFRLTSRHKFQFLTIIIDIVPQLTAIIYIAGIHMKFINHNPKPWGLFIDQYDVYSDIPRWLSITVYLLLSRRYLYSEATAPTGNVQPAIRKWLQQFITIFLVFQGIWLLFLVPYIIPRYSDWLLNKFDWYPIYIPLAIMIYWLGMKGYLISMAPGTEKKKKTIPRDMPKDVVGQTIILLQESMEKDKLYLNPELNLDLVAKHTGIVPKTISAVLNQHQQTSFNEWVNSYRISEFKQKINGSSLQQLTISAIATECGFSSQATFQRIFKQSQGMTPSEYLKATRSTG